MSWEEMMEEVERVSKRKEEEEIKAKIAEVDRVIDFVDNGTLRILSDGKSHSICILVEEIKRLRGIIESGNGT